MRHLFVLVFCFLSIVVYGQNIQVAKSSEELKIIAEIETHTTERVMNFIYAEAVIDNNKAANTYLQIFREQKWWDAPVLLHAELRTFIADGFLADNIYLGGVAFQLLNKQNSFITLEALYRYDGLNNWQATAAYGLFKGRISFSGYSDFYGTKKLYLFSENKIFYRLTKHFKIGTNIELGLNTREGKEFSCYPFAVIRFEMND